MNFAFFLLQAHNYSKPKSGGEALIIGLLTGGVIYGISTAYRAIRKGNAKKDNSNRYMDGS